MCTLTIEHTEGRLIVTMNRDEARARGPELPPEIMGFDNGGHWLGPRDSESGGTWIGVNDAGVVACLLNRFVPNPRAPANPPSRGALVPSLLQLGSLAEVHAWWERQLALTNRAGFSLIASARQEGVELTWVPPHASSTPLEGPWLQRASAGWDTERVQTWRGAMFEAWQESGSPLVNGIPAYHLLRELEGTGLTVLVERETVVTRSITQVVVDYDGAQATVRYWHDPTRRSPVEHPPIEITMPLVDRR